MKNSHTLAPFASVGLLAAVCIMTFSPSDARAWYSGGYYNAYNNYTYSPAPTVYYQVPSLPYVPSYPIYTPAPRVIYLPPQQPIVYVPQPPVYYPQPAPHPVYPSPWPPCSSYHPCYY